MRGLVLKNTGSHYLVRLSDARIADCTVKGKLRLSGVKTTNPIAVGDWVEVDLQSPSLGTIAQVVPRKNYIIRKSTNLSRQSHIIAANIDQALLMATLHFPETPLAFIDRYLVTAEAYSIPTVLIFNKMDLYDEATRIRLDNYVKTYQNIGYQCFTTSVLSGQNIDLVKSLIHNKVTLISGNSGVGKSSLINMIEGRNLQRTKEISAAHLTGKHTTTFSEMFELSQGGYIIDTPGIKGFGLIDIEKTELSHFFPEIFRQAARCKFYNCTHTHEPDCAVIQAVTDGLIAESRYTNYVDMFYNNDEKYR